MLEFWTTFAAADLARAAAFYRAVGFPVQPGPPGVACFTLRPAPGATVCVFDQSEFARQLFGALVDATLAQETVQSVSVATRAEVDALVAAAQAAGASRVQPAKALPFGYLGAFADPDGHLWTILCLAEPTR